MPITLFLTRNPEPLNFEPMLTLKYAYNLSEVCYLFYYNLTTTFFPL